MYHPKINYKNMYEDINRNSLYSLEKFLGVYDIKSMPDAQYGGCDICEIGWLK